MSAIGSERDFLAHMHHEHSRLPAQISMLHRGSHCMLKGHGWIHTLLMHFSEIFAVSECQGSLWLREPPPAAPAVPDY